MGVCTCVCPCVCVHACVCAGAGAELLGSPSGSGHMLCREHSSGMAGTASTARVSRGFLLSEASHRAKADAFQRLIKALPYASLHHFSAY